MTYEQFKQIWKICRRIDDLKGQIKAHETLLEQLQNSDYFEMETGKYKADENSKVQLPSILILDATSQNRENLVNELNDLESRFELIEVNYL